MHPENLKSLCPNSSNLSRIPKAATAPEIVSAILARVTHLESSYGRLKFAMEANQIPKFLKILTSRARVKQIKPRTLELIAAAALAYGYTGIRMNNAELGRYTKLSPRCIRKWRFLYNSSVDYLDSVEAGMLHGISNG